MKKNLIFIISILLITKSNLEASKRTREDAFGNPEPQCYNPLYVNDFDLTLNRDNIQIMYKQAAGTFYNGHYEDAKALFYTIKNSSVPSFTTQEQANLLFAQSCYFLRETPDDLIVARNIFQSLQDSPYLEPSLQDKSTYCLATMLRHGEGGPQNLAAAQNLYFELKNSLHLSERHRAKSDFQYTDLFYFHSTFYNDIFSKGESDNCLIMFLRLINNPYLPTDYIAVSKFKYAEICYTKAQSNDDFTLARSVFEELKTNNDTPKTLQYRAWYYLGKMYDFGQGGPKKAQEALKIFNMLKQNQNDRQRPY